MNLCSWISKQENKLATDETRIQHRHATSQRFFFPCLISVQSVAHEFGVESIMAHHQPGMEHLFLTRRELLRRSGMGFASLGIASLLASEGMLTSEAKAATSSVNPLAPRSPHFPAKAKRVIHLFMNGGPSHVDTFDPKPALARYAGQRLPSGNLRTERKTGAAFPSPFKLQKYGPSGI